ncbi:hypothetical protein SAMN05428981_1011280 [Bacillus sp. OV194]|nr:hypothetical protein SAMN05428981_1011280 [Bacillus sp. OV194]
MLNEYRYVPVLRLKKGGDQLISFQPTEDEQAFKNVAKDLARGKIRSMARECEKKRYVPVDILTIINELGFSSLELPSSWGGLELPLISQAQIMETLSYGDLGIVQGLPGAGDAASLFRIIPDHPLLQQYKASYTNESWPTVAFLNAAGQNDPGSVNLITAPRGSGCILSGTSEPLKMAKFADYLVVAVTDRQGEPLLIWLDSSSQWQLIEGDYRLGLLASGIAKVHFDENAITQDQVLARGEEADELLLQALSRIRVIEAAKETGAMQAALSYAAEYTAQRKAFGQEIARFQGVSFTLADMAIETQAARLLVWKAALKIDEGEPDAASSSLSALNRAHQSLRFVTDCAVQLLGGHGYVQDFPVEKWMRDAQAQVSIAGRESDLLLELGERLLNKKERGTANDLIQNVGASSPG